MASSSTTDGNVAINTDRVDILDDLPLFRQRRRVTGDEAKNIYEVNMTPLMTGFSI